MKKLLYSFLFSVFLFSSLSAECTTRTYTTLYSSYWAEGFTFPQDGNSLVCQQNYPAGSDIVLIDARLFHITGTLTVNRTTYYQCSFSGQIYTESPIVCDSGLVLNTATCTCEAPPTCDLNYIYDINLAICVPDCSLVPNLTLSTDGSTCECLPPFVTVNDKITGSPLSCEPDTDGDGLGDLTNDVYPNDRDNDGFPDDTDPNPDQPDTAPSVPTDCTKVPKWQENALGWVDMDLLTEDRCTVNYLNAGNTGYTHYFSDAKVDACTNCIAFQTQCLYPKVYDYNLRKCTTPELPECSPDPATTHIVQNGSVCYEQTKCQNSTQIASSTLVTCPDADQDGTPDANLSVIGDQETLFNALTQYGAATSTKQDKIIERLEDQIKQNDNVVQNGKKTNDLLKTTNNSLDSIDTKLDSLSTLNTSSQTSNSLLGSQNSKLDTVITNQNLQLLEAKQTNTFFDEMLNKFTDFNLSDITSLLTGDDASIDYASSEMSSALSRYSAVSVFNDGACGVCPTVSGTVFGKNIVFLSQSTIDMFPMDIFRGMIIFFFALSGIIMAFRTV